MLLVGHLAKVQGLKGEFLLHALTDAPERLAQVDGLVLTPPERNLDAAELPPPDALPVTVREFRWHQERPCLAFHQCLDRTAAEPYKGWALWMPDRHAALAEGETFRHDWIGCTVQVAGAPVGEVLRLDPTPMGYDMVILRDLRPGRFGERQVPYIKEWFTLDLPHRTIHLNPPPGLLDLDQN